MSKEVETAFLVTLYADGTFSAGLDPAEHGVSVKRQATAGDVLAICQNLVKEIENGQLTERIAVTLMQLLMPPAEKSVPDAVKEKLKERGIEPDKD
jgi:hypothetical protein